MFSSFKSSSKLSKYFVTRNYSNLASKQFFDLREDDTHSVMESRNTNWSVVLTNSSARMIPKSKSSLACENKMVKELFGRLLCNDPTSNKQKSGSITGIQSSITSEKVSPVERKRAFERKISSCSKKNLPKLILEFEGIEEKSSTNCMISYCSAGLLADSIASLLNKSGVKTDICYDANIANIEDTSSKYPANVIKIQLSNPLIRDKVTRQNICNKLTSSLCKIPNQGNKLIGNSKALFQQKEIEMRPKVQVLNL